MKKQVLSIILMLGITSMLFWGLFSFNEHPNSGTDIGLQYHSQVCVYKNGVLIDCHHNLVTDAGKNMVKSALTNGDNNSIRVMGLGNGAAPTSSSTNLTNLYSTCGLGLADGTLTDNGVGNWTYSHTWTSTCDSQTINQTGLFKQGGGQLFAGTTFTPTTLNTNDQITINYTIWVN